MSLPLGVQAGIEDVYVYTPDYVKGSLYNPNLDWHDCARCIHCGNDSECLHCIKRDILASDGGLDVPTMLRQWYNALPEEQKKLLPLPENNFDISQLEL